MALQATAFDEANCILSAPEGMTIDECEAINVWRGRNSEGTPVVISCWKVTKEDLEILLRTGRLYLVCAGDTMPPVILQSKHPWSE